MTFPPVVVGYDAIYANIHRLPPGQQWAGYSTGTPDICWPRAAFDARPGTLWIDQDAGASDATADYLDVEQGAATIAEAPGWYRRAVVSYRNAERPGQRWPGIYLSASNVTPLVNAFIAAGITSGPRLIVANWNLAQWQALAEVAAASGPFPIAGIQFADPGPYDIDVYSSAWLDAVSARPPPPAPPLPAPQGPFGQFADGTLSLAAIAARRGTTADHLATLTMAHGGRVAMAMLAYLTEGAGVNGRMRKGMAYMTSNP